MEPEKLKYIIEAALLAADDPLSRNQISALFPEDQAPSHKQISEALGELTEDYEPRGIQLCEVASGFRLQIDAWADPWVSKLWRERPPRYSRALLETLALIAYRQPITRGEIEKVRGVSVSSNIMRTLMERDWVRVVGHRDVPGRPALYGTNKAFLDYFGLKSLDDLPTLAEIRDIEADPELDLEGTLRDAAAAAADAEVTASEPADSESDATQAATEQEEDHGDIATEDADAQAVATEQTNAEEVAQDDNDEGCQQEPSEPQENLSHGDDNRASEEGAETQAADESAERNEGADASQDNPEEKDSQAPDDQPGSPAASGAG